MDLAQDPETKNIVHLHLHHTPKLHAGEPCPHSRRGGSFGTSVIFLALVERNDLEELNENKSRKV